MYHRASQQRARRPRVVTRSVPLPLVLAYMAGMIPPEQPESHDAVPVLPPPLVPTVAPVTEEVPASAPPSMPDPLSSHDGISTPPPSSPPPPYRASISDSPPASSHPPHFEHHTDAVISETFAIFTRILKLGFAIIVYRTALDVLTTVVGAVVLKILSFAACVVLLAALIALLAALTALLVAYLVFVAFAIATLLSVGVVVHVLPYVLPYVVLGLFIASPFPLPPLVLQLDSGSNQTQTTKLCCSCLIHYMHIPGQFVGAVSPSP
ncbi:hypothetical protein EVG20_g7544 [Dentipellis fragilis]|uniref:Uncharacterized protein n=1 Tax=Dentipellis fragilis TaxID=205917 RepID=A0A4Y9YEG7_9AGAM|nr:hypothetical protein EVG20_g7544 [Dentipellis fragilis]